MEGVFVPGLLAMVGMYALVFVGALWASKQAPAGATEHTDELLLAGRSLPLWVGLLTMTATWVDGAYINGTAERTFSQGPVWGVQAGVGYGLALILGGLFYARTMRRHAFTTLVDPLEDRYGNHMAALLMVPAVLAELFWSAAILLALGTTFGTVMGVDTRLSILVSSGVAIAYTVLGGLRAVAYTDVIQLVLIFLGLGVAVPYALSAAGGAELVWRELDWTAGFDSPLSYASYADWTIILVLGGIPWNGYFQRVLASRDESDAVKLSIGAGVICALMALPPLFLGLSAANVDWAAIGATPAAAAVGGITIPDQLAQTPALAMALLMRLAVPQWIGVLGLGALAAAVMSSVDSSVLSAASLLAWNGYKRVIKPNVSDHELARVIQVLVIVLGAIATTIALNVQSVAALWYLCGDIVYCVLFPQLTLALFDRKANRTGALAGFCVSVFLRLGGGETTLGFPAFLPYPSWGDAGDFPFRTVAMLGGLLTALAVARLTHTSDPPRALVPRQ